MDRNRYMGDFREFTAKGREETALNQIITERGEMMTRNSTLCRRHAAF